MLLIKAETYGFYFFYSHCGMNASIQPCSNKKAEQKIVQLLWSGWQDSNLRPPRPKRGAITGLRYTPNWSSELQ
jgi:hypothetical protein